MGERGIRRLLPRGSFVAGVATLAVGTAAGQMLILAASPVLTRMYDPSAWGVLAVFVSLLSIAVVVASLRYEFALPLPSDDEHAAQLLVLAIVLLLTTSALLGLGVALFGAEIMRVLHTPQLTPYLWLLPLGFMAAGAYQVLSYWAVRQGEYDRIAHTTVAKNVGMVGTQLGLGFAGAGSLGLLAGDVVGRVSGMLMLGGLAWRKESALLRRVTARKVWQQAVRYRRFPMISSGGSLMNTAGLQIPTLLLAGLYSVQVAGLFALTQRVAGAPMMLIGRAVAQVYLGHGAKLIREHDPAALRIFRVTGLRLVAVGLLPTVALLLAAPSLFSFVFGPEWREAGEFARALALTFLIQFAASPLSQTLNMLEHQGTQVAWDGARLLLATLAIAIPGLIGIPAVAAVTIYGIAMILCYAVLVALSWRVLRSRIRGWGVS